MRIAGVPESAIDDLRKGLNQYLRGVGGVRLNERELPLDSFGARGGIAEAQLGLEDLDFLLYSTGNALDALFTRLRVLLFEVEKPIGSVGLIRADPESYVIEHVSLSGAVEIVQGLAAAEQFPESDNCEARLLQMPQVYLTALVLVCNDSPVSFLVLTPPYREGLAARTPTAFREFVIQLIEGRRRVFPPEMARLDEPE